MTALRHAPLLETQASAEDRLVDRRRLFGSMNAALMQREEPIALVMACIDRVSLSNVMTQGDLAQLVIAAAGPDGVGGRFDDWHYGIVFDAEDPLEGAMVGDAFRRAAANPGVVRPGITLSVGVATGRPGTTTAADLVKAATWALHVAQRRGGNRLVAYDAVSLTPVLECSDDGAAAGSTRAADLL